MATVFLSGPNNSTLFTTCCEVAILDDQNSCPRCQQTVVPEGRSARWNAAYGPIRSKQRWYGNWFPNHGEGRGYYERKKAESKRSALSDTKEAPHDRD